VLARLHVLSPLFQVCKASIEAKSYRFNQAG
jgi:hypothetical protein